LALAKFSR